MPDEPPNQQHAESPDSEFRYLFENMLNGYAYCRMIYDASGKPEDFTYLKVNKSFESLTGLRDVVGKKVTDVIPGIRQTNPELFEIYGRVAQTGKPEIFETYVPGLRVWFSISVYSPKKDHFVAVFETITQRKLAEERLKESEEKHRMLFEMMAEGVIYQDNTGNITAVNPAAVEILGIPEQKLVGQGLMCPGETCYHEDMSPYPEASQPMMLALQGEKQTAVMAVHNPKQHKYRWLIVTSIPLKDPASGKVQRVFTTLFDLSERKATEDMLSQQAQEMSDTIALEEALISSIDVGVIATDERGYIKFINPTLTDLLGIDEKNSIGRPLFSLPITDANGEPLTEERRPIANTLSTRKQTVVEEGQGLFFRKPDGTRMPLAFTVSPVVLGDKLIGTITVFRSPKKETS